MILMESGEESFVAYPGYVMFSEVSKNGDLTIYKNHYNMLVPLAVANYAAGTWIRAEALPDE
jgi:hypothetical protein